MLVAFPAALPHKHRTAIFEQRHAGIFLIIGPLHIHPKSAERPGKRTVQAAGTHAPTVAVGGVVLPDHKSAIRRNGRIGKNLITGQGPHDRVFDAVGSVIICLGRSGHDLREGAQPEQAANNTRNTNTR